MRRLSAKRLGTSVAFAVLALAVVAAFSGLMASGGGLPRATLAPHSAEVAPMLAHPAAVNYTNLAVTVTLTSSFTNYLQLPYNLKWTVSVTNGNFGVNDSHMWVEVRDVAPICQGILGLFVQCPGVVNIGLNSSIVAGTSNYNTTISTAAMSVPQFHPNCPNIAGFGAPCTYANGIFPNDQYQVYVFAEENNTVANSSIFNNTANVTWVDVTASSEQAVYLVTSNPSAQLLAPVAAASLSTGNVSVAITYSGSYVAGAGVSIYKGGAASAANLVYSQTLFAPGVGAQTVVAAAAWSASTPGAYLAQINVSTPYGNYWFNSTLTVIPAGGGTVFINQTTTNVTGSSGNGGKIFGLSAQVGGTVLLVAGLIVGMIVAFALGRMMWAGTPKSGAPAQPWQGKSANECSVCHQTFATEQELKDHAKSAHGMS